jgi:hypothetical protein
MNNANITIVAYFLERALNPILIQAELIPLKQLWQLIICCNSYVGIKENIENLALMVAVTIIPFLIK